MICRENPDIESIVEETSLRLFLALWPDENTRAALTQVAASLQKTWSGRRMRRESLHLTLAFLGDTPVARLDALRQLAATVAGQSFTLTLNSPGCWQHNRVGWLSVKDIPPALAQLVSDLTRVLQTGEFPLDHQPYVPHITLVRNAHCSAPPPCQPVVWHAQSFVLLASPKPGAGGGYDVLGEWPLGDAAAAGT
jgi:2'-5' RNA ligase